MGATFDTRLMRGYTGPYAEAVSNRLKEIAADESEHAEKLRDRITALGGEPTMETAKEELIAVVNLKQISLSMLKEEAKAIDHISPFLKCRSAGGSSPV